ncbi:MAG: hypothetical protein IJU48_06300 [Synergistaceae bacterium]|nr:hypothetical protein [Synergistaceae bacterium]
MRIFNHKLFAVIKAQEQVLIMLKPNLHDYTRAREGVSMAFTVINIMSAFAKQVQEKV